MSGRTSAGGSTPELAAHIYKSLSSSAQIYLYCAVHFMAQEDKLVILLYFSDSMEV